MAIPGRSPPRSPPGRRPLGGLTLGVVLLGVAGALPRWPGILHEVALPPLDLFADARVLMAQASSYPVVVLGLALSVIVRSWVLAMILQPIVPAATARAVRLLAVRAYLVALPFAVIAAGFQFAAAASLYHWYFWIGLAIGVLTTILVAGSVVRAAAGPAQRLRRGFVSSARRGFDLRVVLPYLVGLAALGAVGRLAGRWGSVVLVPASGGLTWGALSRLSGTRRASRTNAVLAGVLVLALVALGVAEEGSSRVPPAPLTMPGAVLFVVPGVDTSSGHGVMFGLDPAALGFACDRVAYFSYAGPGTGAPRGSARCPILSGAPYTNRDSQRPLAQLEGFFAAEIARASAAAGDAPVLVATHSQGAWIAWGAIAAGAAPSVRALIMFGAFPGVSVSYPAPGANGPGRAGGDADRWLSALDRRAAITSFSPDAPLASELLATPGAVASLFSRPLPRSVRAVAVFSDFDLSVAPQGWSVPGVPTSLVAVTHRNLPLSSAALAAADRLLAGGGPTEGGLGHVLWPLLPAFGVPSGDT